MIFENKPASVTTSVKIIPGTKEQEPTITHPSVFYHGTTRPATEGDLVPLLHLPTTSTNLHKKLLVSFKYTTYWFAQSS